MQARVRAIGLLAFVMLPYCAIAQQLSPSALAELAPMGKLRVGIHHANEFLVSKDPEGGELRGVAIDIARELGQRVGVPVEFVAYANAGRMTRAAPSGEWDVAFLAAESSRGAEIIFSAGFAEIDATYLAPAGSPLLTIDHVDRAGIRIAVAGKSAQDQILTRLLKNAQLVRAQGFNGAASVFVSEKLDALAGLRPRLLKDAEKIPGSRVLDGRYAVLPQVIGVPKGREAAARYVREFVEEAKASGLVASAIESAGVRGVALAPRAPTH
jgi:polar amino acid transport system substrate-binding protein